MERKRTQDRFQRHEQLERIADKLLNRIESGQCNAAERERLIRSYEDIDRILQSHKDENSKIAKILANAKRRGIPNPLFDPSLYSHLQANTDTAEKQEKKPEKQTEKKTDAQPSALTMDEIRKTVKTKLEQDSGNREKIIALLVPHGVKRVRDLPEEKLKAFADELSKL